MYINIAGLNDVDKPINNGKKYLESAAANCSISDIPQDFKGEQELRIIRKKILSIEDSLEKLRIALARKREEFVNAERKNVSLIDRM